MGTLRGFESIGIADFFFPADKKNFFGGKIIFTGGKIIPLGCKKNKATVITNGGFYLI